MDVQFAQRDGMLSLVYEGETKNKMADWIKVMEPAQLNHGDMVVVELDRDDVLIGCVFGRVFAVQNECTHEELPLDDGSITGDGALRCQHHGAKFDPFTGKPLCFPAVVPLKTYPVEVRSDGVYLFV